MNKMIPMKNGQENLMPKDFDSAYQCAIEHLKRVGQEGINFLLGHYEQHLSFRVGNQLVFVYIVADVEMSENDAIPSNIFFGVANEANAIPCLLQMDYRHGTFEPSYPGWGLVDASNGQAVDLHELVSTELIEMTDWELNDFAIQYTIAQLNNKDGVKVTSYRSSLNHWPAIWFEWPSGYAWVYVSAVRYPTQTAKHPDNLNDIKQHCAQMSKIGYFAVVSVANSNDPFDLSADKNGNYLPLYRGYGLIPKLAEFEALDEVADSRIRFI